MQLKQGTLLQGGKYRIIRVLGQGGFGITYEAEQVALKRIVAIKEFFMRDCCERAIDSAKVIVPTQSNVRLVDKFKGKFIREAKLIASYDNPHIVRVLDVFEENNSAYYVMENLLGGSLAEKVKKEGPLAESVAEEYVCQVADALSYIHERNTVHLDVKPSNILLNEQGQAVLIDFGISKHYDEAGEQTSTTPVGYSPGYAPIEQNRVGDVNQFKASTDIYALGATLYDLVTGQTPPDASVVYEEGLERPDGISDRIWRTITKSMQDKRANRPQTVSEFLSLLRQDNEEDTIPIFPGDDKTRPKPPIPPSKHGWKLFVALIALILIILSAIFLFNRNHSHGQQQMEWVDLALPSGIKWGTCNLGASSPSSYGSYFAWGEDKEKWKYTEKNYRFPDIVEIDSTSREGSFFWPLSKDPASLICGDSWNVPTAKDFEELRDYCIWEWTELDGINGYQVTGINGNSIFFPAAGEKSSISTPDKPQKNSYGSYWSSTLTSVLIDGPLSVDDPHARVLSFDSKEVLSPITMCASGLSVRPVMTKDRKEPGNLMIVTKPSGANVILDGYNTGRVTTYNSGLYPGKHSIVLEYEGYDDYSFTIVIEPGKHYSPLIDLVPTKEKSSRVDANNHEFVDMGLSVKWATCNLGAQSVTDYGDFYAWAESSPRKSFEENYTIHYFGIPGEKYLLKKYNNSDKNGLVDDRTVIGAEDDAAQKQWGGTWRIPTADEWAELIDNCTWKGLTQNGVKGCLITSNKNNNSIFLPAAGFFMHYGHTQDGVSGLYWTSSLNINDSFSAWIYGFDENKKSGWLSSRTIGYPIRAVIE